MAAAKLPFQIALEQNTNDDSTAFGKWFGKTYSTSDTLSLRGLIERVAFDQSVYSRDIIEGVIDRLTTVMTELLTSGESVKWDGLGTFTPYVESSGVVEVNDYDVNIHVKGIHIRFIPENTKGEQLTSRKFRDQCTLQLAGVWVKRNITVDGKKKVIREFFTMEDYKLNQEHPENNNQGG